MRPLRDEQVFRICDRCANAFLVVLALGFLVLLLGACGVIEL